MDRGAWRALVHRVGKSWTPLSDLACTHACKMLALLAGSLPSGEGSQGDGCDPAQCAQVAGLQTAKGTRQG